jgi:carboxyl-terminal processing protease
MQYSKSPTISRLFRPASLFCAGFFVLAPLTAAVAVAGQQQVAVNTAATAPFAATPATTPAKAPASDIARWSDTVWNAARSGDLETVEKALKEVPESHAVDESKRLREIVAARASHVDAGAKTRDADRAKALEEIKTELGKNEVTKALTAAVKFQTLSDDMASALKVSEIQDVVKAAEAAYPVAEEKGDWLVAQEILFRLRTLHELSDGAVFRSYDAKLDEVNKRIMLLAQYAPRELYRLRRELALRLDPEKPFPEFNEAFAEDWKEALDGISKGMLASALSTAANEHISGGGWEPLIKGGLNAVRVLATTPALKENFPGIADPAKAQTLVDAVTRNVEGLARMDRDAIGKPQFNAAIRDIMEANQKGPDLPLTVVFREFGDGALEELAGRFEDEYSQVIWPEQLRRFEQMVKGNFVGVGIMIRHDDRRDIQVINPLEGGPAFRSGVEPDDRITAVDGKSTVGWTLNKAVDSITGPAGEDVTLTIKREGAEQPVDIKLTREEIKIRSVNGWWKKALDMRGSPVWDWYIDPTAGIGYIRLTSFNDDSFDDFNRAIAEMRSERKLNGLILDLRFNPGGLLKSAVDFSNAFVEDGKIVAGQDRMGRQVWQMKAQPQAAIYKDLPLVVLVNQGSASASEIVSGCLKAHDRAVVIGDRSFGKGSVQTVHPCGDGRADAQLKLTTQYYVLPPGPGETEPRLVHKRPGTLDWGVLPDLVVKMTPDQIEKSTMLRQNADVIEQKKAKADAEPKARPNVEELVTTGVDPQLELALLVLQARSLKELDAAAQAAAVDSKKSDQSGG